MAKYKRTRKDKIEAGEAPTPKYTKTIEIRPRTTAQQDYIQAINTFDTTIGIGSAGTGKSYIPLAMAARDYAERKIEKIILLRPLVAVDNKGLGFFKGTFEEKIAPWAAAPLENLSKILGKERVERMVKHEEIMLRPLGYERGVTYDNAFVILDEAQNATPAELEMFLTRIGDNARVVLTGDPRQSDLGRNSGLTGLVGLCEKLDLPVGVVNFDTDDIVRSNTCKMWVTAFETFPSKVP